MTSGRLIVSASTLQSLRELNSRPDDWDLIHISLQVMLRLVSSVDRESSFCCCWTSFTCQPNITMITDSIFTQAAEDFMLLGA